MKLAHDCFLEVLAVPKSIHVKKRSVAFLNIFVTFFYVFNVFFYFANVFFIIFYYIV